MRVSVQTHNNSLRAGDNIAGADNDILKEQVTIF